MNNTESVQLAKSIESAAKTYVLDTCCDKPIMFKPIKKGLFYRCTTCGRCYYDYSCGWCKDSGTIPYALWIDDKPVERIAICKCKTAFEMNINDHTNYKDKPPDMSYYFQSTVIPDKAPISYYKTLFHFDGQDDEYNYHLNLQKALMGWRYKQKEKEQEGFEY